MKVLLFGVSNVGKTTIGKILANRLGIRFFDLDDEVRNRLGMTLEEFVSTADLRWRDQKRGRILKELIRHENDLVVAVSPISYTDNFKSRIIADEILLIELYDEPENIFARLVFSDENDVVYTDEEYKNRHKAHYLREIQSDLSWYGNVYRNLGVKNRIFINNDPPENVADRIIAEYHLASQRGA